MQFNFTCVILWFALCDQTVSVCYMKLYVVLSSVLDLTWFYFLLWLKNKKAEKKRKEKKKIYLKKKKKATVQSHNIPRINE